MSLYPLLTTEKKLRMMWKVEKDKKASYLVGAAHFSLTVSRNFKPIH